MQSVNFPISFPAYAYKVRSDNVSGPSFRYGVLDQDLNRLAQEFETLDGLAEHVVSELLQLKDLPSIEEIPDSLSDLSDEDWRELNRGIELHAQRNLSTWTAR